MSKLQKNHPSEVGVLGRIMSRFTSTLHSPPRFVRRFPGLNHELIPWLYEASHRAFGPGGTANVRCLPDASGYCAYEADGAIGHAGHGAQGGWETPWRPQMSGICMWGSFVCSPRPLIPSTPSPRDAGDGS